MNLTMQFARNRPGWLWIGLAALALVVACGGGSGSNQAASPQTVPEDTAVFAVETNEIPKSDSAPAEPVAGAFLFELPSASGDTVSLNSYVGEKNVVLVFYRGFW